LRNLLCLFRLLALSFASFLVSSAAGDHMLLPCIALLFTQTASKQRVGSRSRRTLNVEDASVSKRRPSW
jgi:hypothetical protein